MTRTDKWIAFGILVVLTVVAVATLRGNAQCELSGGKYVRGLFWYECVKAAP